MKELLKFKALGLSENILRALDKKGIEEPTPIQEKCIPLVLKNKTDVVGQAQTGTGKTMAFGLPIIEMVDPTINATQALILAPTRELAIQVAEQLNTVKGDKKIKIAAIYGGQSIELQFARLREGVQVMVGTPGRVIDHLKRKKLDLSKLSFFVLDEADEMLNMGFIDDVEEILKTTPKEKRMMLFSATMPRRILDLAKKYMPKFELVEIKKEMLTTNLTDQIYFEVAEADKFESLCRIIDMEPEFYGMIFCRTKLDVDMVVSKLNDRGYGVEGIHGDVMQNQREKIFQRFKTKKTQILVATDVAARGIDVTDLTHVVNFSLPHDPESYVHRIGRTGRAGKQGTAITFITPYEYRKLAFIGKITRTEIRKEKVPAVQDVIDLKKNRIMTEIKEMIEAGEQEDFDHFAQEISKDLDPNKVISALLKYSFYEELDKNSYKEIKEFRKTEFRERQHAPFSPIDKEGKTRLFVAMGGNSGLNARKLVDYITKQSKVKGSMIDDVKVYDDFSFVSVNFRDAEIILKAFKNEQSGKRPLVVKAKEKR